MGTVEVSPSPESNTKPVVLPVEYKARTDWTAIYNDGTLNVSNMISAVFYLFYDLFFGAES
jgi:hypothetical protein